MVETEQQAMLEAAPVEQTYQVALATYVEGKQEQAGRIEDHLENLIDQQKARLQQAQTSAPGLLALPGAKRAWRQKAERLQARLQTLCGRLETVREIKEGMGLHSPRIEELATRKMRAENPELASDWDAMRQAARQHELLMRKQRQENKTLGHSKRSQTLDISARPDF
jgi:DNA repair exonuclease SbcCD ATPase subunit